MQTKPNKHQTRISNFILFLHTQKSSNLYIPFKLSPQIPQFKEDMKTIMARTPHESSFSFSRRYFNWRIKKSEDDDNQDIYNDEHLSTQTTSHSFTIPQIENPNLPSCVKSKSYKLIPRFKSPLSLFSKSKPHLISQTLGTKVTGTLFGHRRGHVLISFQEEPRSRPAFLIQISTPTSVLVREMASGLVRVALECDRKVERKGMKLLEEPLWRAYCNGRKCGYATRRDPGEEEMKVLAAVGRVTMGAGVLPGGGDGAPDGELMYMRAEFERVVGSRDSEAFYMINPDRNGGPELSVYLLRV